MIGTLYIVFKPKLNIRFDQQFEAIPMNKQRWITLAIFVFIALSWVFSSQINPILAGALGLEGKIASFDSVIALSAAVILCVAGVTNWKQIQDNILVVHEILHSLLHKKNEDQAGMAIKLDMAKAYDRVE